jgi:23S rRNA (cytosine1962-C5)-methyltransferase
MLILKSNWPEYELVDSGNGKRLERFGKYLLSRPDPQCIWKPRLIDSIWEGSDAKFIESMNKAERGRWIKSSDMPEKWLMKFMDLKIWVKLSPFKHTGVFPEQSEHWIWIAEKINNYHLKNKDTNKKLNILNLFAYTGMTSLVCAKEGASVTHVDASRPTIGWARENQMVSQLESKPMRWILDDAMKFVGREIKRGVKYDGIIMDPPIYGHGPEGERWDFYESMPQLLELCRQVLSVQPVFILINAYAISASFIMLENLLKDFNLPGNIESGELVLKEKDSDRLLSTGIFARWSKE